MTTRSGDNPSLDITEAEVQTWKAMTPAQKAEMITTLWRAEREAALAGIRSQYPNASPREQFLRLAMITLGAELARQAYPEIGRMGLE